MLFKMPIHLNISKIKTGTVAQPHFIRIVTSVVTLHTRSHKEQTLSCIHLINIYKLVLWYIGRYESEAANRCVCADGYGSSWVRFAARVEWYLANRHGLTQYIKDRILGSGEQVSGWILCERVCATIHVRTTTLAMPMHNHGSSLSLRNWFIIQSDACFTMCIYHGIPFEDGPRTLILYSPVPRALCILTLACNSNTA